MSNLTTITTAETREIDTLLTLLGSGTAQTRTSLGMTAVRLPSGVAVTSLGADPGGFWNRVIGLGLFEPATPEATDAAIQVLTQGTADVARIQVVPELLTDDWAGIAEHHRLRRSSAWYKLGLELRQFTASSSGPPVRQLREDEVDEGSRLLGGAFGWSDEVVDAVYSAPVRSGALLGFGAFDGDRMIASATVAVGSSTAHMYGAATLPEYQRRGAQTALIAARAVAAREAGCELAIAETWVPETEGGNPSLNNMVRSGFEVLYQRDNWVWERPNDAPDTEA